MSNNRRTATRGFVIVVVLAAAVVMAAVVAAQLMTSKESQLVGIRASEEARARAIAESCLDMVSKAIDQVDPTPAWGDDYDEILDGADATLGNGDDFVPFGTRLVTIPVGAGANPFNRWELIPMASGACAVRFDDNSDDGRPLLPGPGGEEANEGPLNGPNPNKDRDRSIFITAIGLYPLLPTTADAAAYDAAHARVTLRRVVQRVNVYQPFAPGLWAGSVTLASNVDICGYGGISATGGVNGSSNDCACGNVLGTVTPAGTFTSGATCGSPRCPTQSAPTPQCIPTTISTTAPVAPPAWLHWMATGAGMVRDREGWSSPAEVPLTDQNDTATNHGQGWEAAPADDGNIADTPAGGVSPAPFCAFYAEEATRSIFVWDSADDHTATTLETLNGGPLGPGATNIPQHDCRPGGGVADLDPVPGPCSWTINGAIDCSGGKTPCWKLQAKLDGTMDDDIGPGGISAFETTGDSGFGEDWHPNKNRALPHVAYAKTFGANGANTLCGDSVGGPGNCASCKTDGTDNAAAAIIYSTFIGGHWHFENGMSNERMPSPSLWIFDASNYIHFWSDWGSGSGPWRTTLITSTNFGFGSYKGDMCCALCDCATAAGINRGTCGMSNAFGELDADVQTITTLVGQVFGGAGGYLLKSADDIDLPDQSILVGDIRGASVDSAGSNCIVGNVVGYGGGGTCGGGTCSGSRVCIAGSDRVNGDIHSAGDIDFTGSNIRTYGNLVARGDVCMPSNVYIEGAVMATGTVDMASNTKVVNTSSSSTGVAQAANQPITTYSEASW